MIMRFGERPHNSVYILNPTDDIFGAHAARRIRFNYRTLRTNGLSPFLARWVIIDTLIAARNLTVKMQVTQ